MRFAPASDGIRGFVWGLLGTLLVNLALKLSGGPLPVPSL